MKNTRNNFSDHIAIIGAGIAGLCLGCFLKKSGLPVIIFEKSSSVSNYGAGITISPNGINILKYLDIDNQFISNSFSPSQTIINDTSKDILKISSNVITSSRKTLYSSLKDKYLSLGGEIFFDHQLTNVDLKQTKLIFKNFKEYKFAHIVGCDGIKSVCRKYLLDKNFYPIYSGYSAWRSIIPAKQENIQLFIAPNQHIVTYPINSNEVSFVGIVKTPNTLDSSWKRKGAYSEVLKEFSPFKNLPSSIINKKNDYYKWGIYISPDSKNFCSKNLTLLGDAAHPILPFLGQGACMSLEDAHIFAQLLIKNIKNIKKAQTEFENIRIPRIKKIQEFSKMQGFLNHISNPLVINIRNFIMQTFPSFINYRLSDIWSYKSILESKN